MLLTLVLERLINYDKRNYCWSLWRFKEPFILCAFLMYITTTFKLKLHSFKAKCLQNLFTIQLKRRQEQVGCRVCEVAFTILQQFLNHNIGLRWFSVNVRVCPAPLKMYIAALKLSQWFTGLLFQSPQLWLKNAIEIKCHKTRSHRNQSKAG